MPRNPQLHKHHTASNVSNSQWSILWSSNPPTCDHTDTKMSKFEFLIFFFKFGQMTPNLGREQGDPLGSHRFTQITCPINFENFTSEKFQFWQAHHWPNGPKFGVGLRGPYRAPKICSNFTPHQLWNFHQWKISILTGASLAKWAQIWGGT